MAKESNVPEETDQDLAESTAQASRGLDIIKPMYLKGLFSVSTTSYKPLPVIWADIIRVLNQLGVMYHKIKGGFKCKHTPSIDLNNVVDSSSTPRYSSSSGTGHRHKINFSSLMGADLLINKPRLLVCLLVCFIIKQPIKPRGLILAVN